MRKDVYPLATPEEMGVASEAIRGTIAGIREENGLELHSFLMLRRGALIWEEYFREGEAERAHLLYSVSKSFTSTAIGIAQAQGLLSVEDKLYDFFPEHKALCDSERKASLRLKHLLMMGSGFENNEGDVYGNHRSELTKYALMQPVIHAPGKVFNYYSLGTYLLSAAFSRAVPEGVHAYLKRKLFGPMEITKSTWQKEEQGVSAGGTGLKLCAYDLTKLGQMYLQNGVWEGQQLVPAAYVKAATRKQIDNRPQNSTPDWQAGYGYQFWRNSFGGFRADGMLGQYIIVLPEQETVIVMTSNLRDMQLPLTILAQRLIPAIT